MNHCATLVALFCFFAISLASHAPPESDELSTKVSLPNAKDSTPAAVGPTFIPLRMVNRRFPVRSKRPCRRHHRKIKIAEILPGGENGDFQEPIVPVVGRRIPGRWMRLRHHDLGDDGDRVGRERKGIRVLMRSKKMGKVSFTRRMSNFLDNYF